METIIRRKNNIIQKIKQMSLLEIFVVVCGINLLIQLILLFISDGKFLGEIVWDARHGLGRADDFIGTINRLIATGNKPYIANDWDARYPPFAYLFYSFLSSIIPNTITNSNVSDWVVLYEAIVTSISVAICVLLIREFLVQENFFIVLLSCVAIIFSHPFGLAAIKAANSTLYVLDLVLLALLIKDSKSKIARELALLMIAIAAGFKMTPAILGILYIKEKRWKESVRLVIYGIVFCILPFAFFGGIDALKNFIHNISLVSNAEIPRPETIIGVFIEFGDIVLGSAHKGFVLGKIVSFIYFFTVIIIYLLSNDKTWKPVCLLSTLMVVFTNQSYPYTLIYLIIPLLLLFTTDKNKIDLFDKISVVFFSLIFAVFPFLKIDWPTATFITNYAVLYIFIITLIVNQLIFLIYHLNEK